MIRYRPQKSTLKEALQEERKFATIDEMFSFVQENMVRLFRTSITEQDITISKNFGKDDRTDWKETRYVYVYVKYRRKMYCAGICSIE